MNLNKSICSILLAAAPLLASCLSKNRKVNWNVTLAKDDKKPYGCFIARQSMQYLAPGAKIIDLSAGFRYTNIDEKMMHPAGRRAAVLVAAGLNFYVTQGELKRLAAFAAAGNEVMIFTRTIDDQLGRYLHCNIQGNGWEETPLSAVNRGSRNIGTLSLAHNPATFGYDGRSVQAAIIPDVSPDTVSGEQEDEVVIHNAAILTDTLGYVRQQPNFLRYSVGAGHIMVHTAPLTLSNYFLLQANNKAYLEGVFSYLPENTGIIYWNDFYKRSTQASDLGVLLRYPAMRWALFIAVFALLIYILFESKRRQRLIPEIQPPENTSASFVETIGRLYYDRSDHTNLGQKMIQHFLEWVRTHYFINTNLLDDVFTERLTLKSGLPEANVAALMELIREVQIERKPIDETDLYHLHNTIQQFYNNYKK